MIVIIIMIVAGLFLLTTNNYDLTKKEGRKEFTNVYFGWIGKVVSNTAGIAGYAVKMEWMPKKPSD